MGAAESHSRSGTMEESEYRHYMLNSMLQLHNPLQILVIGHRKSSVETPVDTRRLIRWVISGLYDRLVQPQGERLPGIVDAQWLPRCQIESPMIIYQISGRTKVETDEEYLHQIKLFLDSRTIDLIWYVRDYEGTNEDSVIAHKLGTMLKNDYSEIPVLLLRKIRNGSAVVENYELDKLGTLHDGEIYDVKKLGTLHDWVQSLEAPKFEMKLFDAMSHFLRSQGRMHQCLTWVVSKAAERNGSISINHLVYAARLIADVVLGSEKAVSERTSASSKALFCHCMLQQLFTTFHKMLAPCLLIPYDPTPDDSFVSPPFLRLLSKAAPGSVSKILLVYSVCTLGCTLHYLAQQAKSGDSGPKLAEGFSAIWSDYGKSRAAKRDWRFGRGLLRHSSDDWHFGCGLLRHSSDDGERIVSLISSHFASAEEFDEIEREYSRAYFDAYQEFDMLWEECWMADLDACQFAKEQELFQILEKKEREEFVREHLRILEEKEREEFAREQERLRILEEKEIEKEHLRILEEKEREELSQVQEGLRILEKKEREELALVQERLRILEEKEREFAQALERLRILPKKEREESIKISSNIYLDLKGWFLNLKKARKFAQEHERLRILEKKEREELAQALERLRILPKKEREESIKISSNIYLDLKGWFLNLKKARKVS